MPHDSVESFICFHFIVDPCNPYENRKYNTQFCLNHCQALTGQLTLDSTINACSKLGFKRDKGY